MVDQQLKIYTSGYCTQKEKFFKKGGSNSTIRFNGNSFVITTSHGLIVFDTGYSHHFIKETQKYPYTLYVKLIPVFLESGESLIEQLNRDGISDKDVKYVVISHFHADHYAGLKDFPTSKVITSKIGYQSIHSKSRFRSILRGFIPELMPEDFKKRVEFFEEKESIPLPETMCPYTKGFDLFGDKSVISISLEGHARGQYGLLFNNTFIVADAVWSDDFLTENNNQTFLADWISDNPKKVKINHRMLRELHLNNKDLNLFYSHMPHE